MKDREILLGVTGGIAAYKTADLCSKLMQAGAGVSVVMTEAATRFVGPTTFEALTGRPVLTDLWTPQTNFRGEHIGLAQAAELFVVAPATADFIGKVANGLADDLLSTLAMTTTCPFLFAPAMNTAMWEKPAVQRNVSQLQTDGVHIVAPGSGWLSCGQVGAGRMAEPKTIFDQIADMLATND